MKMLHLLSAMTFAAALAVPFPVAAEERDSDAGAAPFQFSVWDSVQVVDEERSIHGLRLTLPYGANRNLHGLDVGIANHLDGDLRGAQLSWGGYVAGDFAGLQYNWILAIVDGQMTGMQSALYSSAGTLRGLQLGFVNRVVEEAMGARLSLVNISETSSVGAEIGLVNYSKNIEGLQLGLVNVTDGLRGVQLGLVNVARNGFFPVFVLFNAAI